MKFSTFCILFATSANVNLCNAQTATPSSNPVSSPSSSPSSSGGSCDDSPLAVTGTGGKGCVDVVDNLSLCNFPGATSHCPDTCGACSEYECSDSELGWDLLGGSFNCGMLAAQDETSIESFCDSYPELTETCRSTCGTCGEGEWTNVALGQVTAQSSTSSGGVSSRAVDGNRSGIYNNGSVTHTGNEAGPYWTVLLADPVEGFSIEEIRVYNRVEAANRLDSFIVEIYFQADVVWTYENPPGTPPYENILSVGGVQGTSIDVRLPDSITGVLSLAEVEIYSFV